MKHFADLIEYYEEDKKERSRLILERAEAANREMQVRLLIELIDGKDRLE